MRFEDRRHVCLDVSFGLVLNKQVLDTFVDSKTLETPFTKRRQCKLVSLELCKSAKDTKQTITVCSSAEAASGYKVRLASFRTSERSQVSIKKAITLGHYDLCMHKQNIDSLLDCISLRSVGSLFLEV